MAPVKLPIDPPPPIQTTDQKENARFTGAGRPAAADQLGLSASFFFSPSSDTFCVIIL